MLAAALVLLFGSAPFLFDRDNDGEEDGRLELCPAPRWFLPGALPGWLVLPRATLTRPPLLARLSFSPRSPPKGVLSRKAYLFESVAGITSETFCLHESADQGAFT